jgi:hypothetical protein
VPSLQELSETKPVRLLIPGYPGAGKTSSLAALANMGYKLRILDYDNNIRPLIAYTNPNADVDVVTIEDTMRMAVDGTLVPNGIPMGYKMGLDMLDEWKYTAKDGTEVNLGRTADWDHTHVLVLDSITSQGTCAMRRALSLNNRTAANRRSQEWGLAQQLQLEVLKRLVSKRNNFHVIVLSHIKPVGPKDIGQDDDNLTIKLKERAASLIPTRLYPTAIGNALPPEIPGLFDTVLLAERRIDTKGNVSRVLTVETGPELDVKVAAKNFPSTLPIETGLRTLFEAQVPWSVSALRSANDNQRPNAASKAS